MPFALQRTLSGPEGWTHLWASGTPYLLRIDDLVVYRRGSAAVLNRTFRHLSLVLYLGVASLRGATIVNWVDWTSGAAGANGTATGSLQFGLNTVDVDYAGQIAFLITGVGTNYWTEPNPAA